MWEYKITKSDLGFNIYRTRDENWIVKIERLQGKTYTWNREFAKTFYTLDSAVSALVIQKVKDEK